MLEKAMRLCDAAFGVLWAYEGDRYRAAAAHGAPVAFVEFLRQPLQLHYHPGSGLERALRGENLVINDDMAAEEAYRADDPLRRAIVSWAVLAAMSSLRCARTRRYWAQLPSIARKCGRSRTSRLRCYKISPRRRSLRWRTRG